MLFPSCGTWSGDGVTIIGTIFVALCVIIALLVVGVTAYSVERAIRSYVHAPPSHP